MAYMGMVFYETINANVMFGHGLITAEEYYEISAYETKKKGKVTYDPKDGTFYLKEQDGTMWGFPTKEGLLMSVEA